MKRNWWYLSIFCFSLWAQTLELSFGKQKTKPFIRVLRVQAECPGHSVAKGKKFVFHYFNMSQSAAHKQVIDIKFELIDPPAHPEKGKMTFLKCETQNLESCVEVISFKADVCEMMKGKGIYKMYYDNIKPRISCPLKSGVYELSNFSIDADEILTVVPPGITGLYENNFDVRFIMGGKNSNELVCMEALFKFEQVRKRNG